jgi:hypothetical protein
MVLRLSPTQLASVSALRGALATQTEPLEASQSAASTRPCPRGARHPEVPEAHAATWPAARIAVSTMQFTTPRVHNVVHTFAQCCANVAPIR